MEPEILPLCRAACSGLETLGCRVDDVVPTFSFARLWSAWVTLRHWLVAGSLGEAFADPSRRARMKPEARWEVEGGLGLRAVEVYRASVDRSAWYGVVLDLFSRYDFLVLPSAQVLPFDAAVHWPERIGEVPMDTYHRWMEVVVPATLTGCPTMGVPVGFSAAGLPMGMQIVGRPRADLEVLQLAHAYDRATRWTHRFPPPLLTDDRT